MKKFVKILSLMVVCVAMSVLAVACGNHTHAFDTSSWKTDATKHWHSATCEHTTVLADVDGHKDENIDGTCDVCGYNGGHVHTFESVISYDATNHYFKSTCFHNVVDGKEAHDFNEANVCKDCGYAQALTQLPETVEEAVELGVSQKVFAKSGYISNSDYSEMNYTGNASSKYYVYGDNFVYVKNGVDSYGSITEEYYAGNEEVVYGLMVQDGADPYSAYGTTDLNLNGPVMPKDFIGGYGYESDFYGVEDLVASLYEMASANENYDFQEAAEDGMYGFMFGYVLQQGEDTSLYMISTFFTLSAKYGYIESVQVMSKLYQNYYDYENERNVVQVEELVLVDEDGEPVLDENEEQITYFAPVIEYNYSTIYSVAISQFDVAPAIENPFKPEDVIPTSIDYVDEDGESYAEDINVEIGTALVMNVVTLPETAMLKLFEETAVVEVEALDEEATGSGFVQYDFTYDMTVIVNFHGATIGETYLLTIDIAGFYNEYTITITEAIPDELFVAKVMQGEYSWDAVEVTDSVTTYVGPFYFVAETNKVASAEYAISGGLDIEQAIDSYEENITVWVDNYNTYLRVKKITFAEVGTYTLTITSGLNDELTKTLTINVVEAPSVAEILNATWEISKLATEYEDGAIISAVFENDADNTTADTIVGTITVEYTYLPSEMAVNFGGQTEATYNTVFNYSYSVAGTTLTVTYASGDETGMNFMLNLSSYAIQAQVGYSAPFTLTMAD